MEAGVTIAALLIGAAIGLRSFAPLAVLSAAIYTGHLPSSGFLPYLGSFIGLLLLSVFALGELIADKTPAVPNRTDAFPLIGRMCLGGFSGYTLAAAANGPRLLCAVIGLAAAAAGAFGGFLVRRRLTKEMSVPDLPVALVEDAVCISLAVAACFLLV